MFEFLKIYYIEGLKECRWIHSNSENPPSQSISDLPNDGRDILQLLTALTSEEWELYPFSNNSTPYKGTVTHRLHTGKGFKYTKLPVHIFYLRRRINNRADNVE